MHYSLTCRHTAMLFVVPGDLLWLQQVLQQMKLMHLENNMLCWLYICVLLLVQWAVARLCSEQQ